MDGRGFVAVLSQIALQAPLDSARGELPSDTRTLICRCEILRGKIGEIWTLDIASLTVHTHGKLSSENTVYHMVLA